ncbi:LOW QUALITY PROTEIN: hypothetical protein PanWU01x14_160500, partial [Parasponia andersonii]
NARYAIVRGQASDLRHGQRKIPRGGFMGAKIIIHGAYLRAKVLIPGLLNNTRKLESKIEELRYNV